MNAGSLVEGAIALEEYFRHEIAEKSLGGPARLKVILLLACVLGLDSADTATIGALAVRLETALHIDNTQVGLLVTASTAIGALATLPVGVLADRVRRVDMLTAAISIWSIAMVVSGFSTSYLMLLFTRLALGAVVATAAPVIASLTGDFFPPAERGRIYGYILTGELVGAGIGFMLVGSIAAALSWRASFWTLALFGFALAAAVGFWLPEPARGGQSQISAGDEDIVRAADVAAEAAPTGNGDPHPRSDDRIQRAVDARDISPRSALVLSGDAEHMSAWQAFAHVLRIPTIRTLILASSLGYFYFTGLRTFAVVFLRGRFGLTQTGATMLLVAIGVGAIVGALTTGRLSDWLIARGRLTARIGVTGAAFLIAAALFLPGILIPTLFIAAPLLFIAAVALGGTNPPLDAARLDIVHYRLWGRAESIRTALRFAFEAVAPILFGFVSTLFGGGASDLGRASPQTGQAGAVGLDYTFVIMLVPLIIAGVIMLWARRTYPRDVATAAASERATRRDDENPGPSKAPRRGPQ